MSDIVERLREVFQRRRYGAGAEYDPDFDLFDEAVNEINRLRTTLSTQYVAHKTEIDRLCALLYEYEQRK